MTLIEIEQLLATQLLATQWISAVAFTTNTATVPGEFQRDVLPCARAVIR
jgi:hypothetical protein